MLRTSICIPALAMFFTACVTAEVDDVTAEVDDDTDDADDADADDDTDDASASEPRSRCVVTTPGEVVAIAASDAGVAIAVVEGTDGDEPLVIHRAHGADCALAWDDAPLAAAALLDFDDDGDVYLFPAETRDADVLSTLLPEFFAGLDSTIARVDTDDAIAEVVSAGRGIWSFGVSPSGDALWMTACGPTGIFTLDDDELTPTMPPPSTLWQQQPSVLTDDETFWSIGTGTCGTAPSSPACGFALVRTTATGSTEVGPTILDVGAGLEAARLARCGASVCGVLSRAIVRWDDDGHIERTISASDLGARTAERVLQVAGNHHGVYALLGDDAGTRVLFVPDEPID